MPIRASALRHPIATGGGWIDRGRAAAALAVLTLAVLLVLACFRSPWSRVWGDEGTFLAMMASLAEDADLRFDERDSARLEAAEGGGTHVILQRGSGGVSYSKPVIYALAAAPFYAVLGELGPVLLNALALALALAFAFAYLRRLGDDGAAALVLVTFAGGGVLVPYVAWRMTDSFQASLSIIALALCFARERGASRETSPGRPRGVFERLLDWPGAPRLGMMLLAVLTIMRISNGILILVPVLAALFGRRLKDAAVLALTAVAACLALVAVTLALTGVANPYRASRTTFTPETGYPAGAAIGDAMARFDTTPAADRTGLYPNAAPLRVAYSAFYFFAGRHTGLIFYFPAALVFFACALRRSDRVGRACLLGAAGAATFFIVWRPENYFGGSTFIGNRYLLSVYPLALFALPRLPGPRRLAAVWMLAGVSYASALLSVLGHHELDSDSQSHTRAGIFRLLPYESTSRDIAGLSDRYWAGHFVRFVDPFARVHDWHMELHAGRPPAEMLIADWRPAGKIRLYVKTAAADAMLEVWDYGHRAAFPVGAATGRRRSAGILGVAVDVETSSPWRRHRYWWYPEILYGTRSLRLSLAVPGGGPATAEVRYFGDPERLEKAFAYERLGEEAPATAVAGSTSRVSFRVRNTSPLIWEREDVVPVLAGYRLHGEAGGPTIHGQPVRLPARVEPLQEVSVTFDVAWPEEPGVYRLEADLVLRHVARFATRLGEPVLRRQVTVTAVENKSP